MHKPEKLSLYEVDMVLLFTGENSTEGDFCV